MTPYAVQFALALTLAVCIALIVLPGLLGRDK